MMAPMASHCIKVNLSSSSAIPDIAANAGCKLVRVPNVFVGSRLRATISSV